ncbi:MAG: type III-A CRISPR-associated protein Cas10/Csm1 [Cyanobacteria bacterium]|nr:type III-A CRISPR-associated protein Cas10/Csm1 [Cyanobacteriota bacterium]
MTDSQTHIQSDLPQLKNVIYGALLHDIGKLFYKSGTYQNHVQAGEMMATQLWAGQDVPKLVKDCISNHHAKHLKKNQNDVSPQTWIIYEADNIAAGLDRRDENEFQDSENDSFSQPAVQDPEKRSYFEKYIPLTSVFDQLRLTNQEGHLQDGLLDETKIGSYQHAYPLRMLGKEDLEDKPIPVYPSKRKMKDSDNKEDSEWFQAPKEKYESIIKKWTQEVSKNGKVLTQNPNALILLMESMLSFAPSDTFNGRIPDISLFEHLRITAAVASCMYVHAVEAGNSDFKTYGHWDSSDHHRNRETFLLVGGDISGVQKFIYNISSKGALKGLRARSFYLEILTEHIIDEILALCGGLSRANIIFNGGGHFYLLLPNTTQTKDTLALAQKRLNQWLWNQFRGGLSMALAYEPCTPNDLMDPQDLETKKRQGRLKEKWQSLSQKLSLLKSRKFSELDPDEFVNLFEPSQAQPDGKECEITQLDHDLIFTTDQDGNPVCKNRLAHALQELGKHLPKADYVWIDRHESQDELNFMEDAVQLPDLQLLTPNNTQSCCSLRIFKSKNESGDLQPQHYKTVNESRQSSDPGKLYSINRWVLSDVLHANLLVGQYYYQVPDQAEDYMPCFEDLAKASTGNGKIGVMRADVDDLGTLFKSKLPQHVNTFSRVAMLSKHLSLFFKLYINRICDGQLANGSDPGTEKLSPYRVFPDLDQPKLSNRPVVIVYAGGDDLFIVGAWNYILELSIDIRRCFEHYTCGKLTLSTGVQVFDPKAPISQMAAMTEVAEKKAKKYKNKEGQLVKNALCLFPNPRVLDYQADNATVKRGLKFRDTYAWDELLQDLDNLNSDTLLGILRQILEGNYQCNDNNTLEAKADAWLPPTAMYKLYQLGESWSEKGVLSLPQLAYMLARMESRLKEAQKRGEISEAQLKSFKQIKSFLYQTDWVGHSEKELASVGIQDYKTLFTWISYLSREKI